MSQWRTNLKQPPCLPCAPGGSRVSRAPRGPRVSRGLSAPCVSPSHRSSRASHVTVLHVAVPRVAVPRVAVFRVAVFRVAVLRVSVPNVAVLLATVLLATVLLAIASPGLALADSDAEALHRKALEAASDGSYREARQLWEKAYGINREPKYLFNLAQVAEESDRPTEALDLFERFIKEAGNRPQYQAYATKARARVKALLQRVAILEVRTEQAGVEVFVNQRSLGKGPLSVTMRLPQGKHLVVANLHGHHGQTHTMQLYGGQRRQLTITLDKIRPKIIRQKARVIYPMPRWLPWTILGVGLAVAAGGIAPMAMQKSAYDDYNASIDPPFMPKGDMDLKRRADRLYASGIALLVTGGVLAAAGLVTVLLNKPKVVHDRPKEAGSSGDEPHEDASSKGLSSPAGPGEVALVKTGNSRSNLDAIGFTTGGEVKSAQARRKLDLQTPITPDRLSVGKDPLTGDCSGSAWHSPSSPTLSLSLGLGVVVLQVEF